MRRRGLNPFALGMLASAAITGGSFADNLYVSKGMAAYIISGVPSDHNIDRMGGNISSADTIVFSAGTVLITFANSSRKFRESNGNLTKMEMVLSETGVWAFIENFKKEPDEDTPLYWGYGLIENVRLPEGWFSGYQSENYAPILILQRPTEANVVEPSDCERILLEAPMAFSNVVVGDLGLARVSLTFDPINTERHQEVITMYLNEMRCRGQERVKYAVIEIPKNYYRILLFDESKNITFDIGMDQKIRRLRNDYLLYWRIIINNFRIGCREEKERVWREAAEIETELEAKIPGLNLGGKIRALIETERQKKTKISAGFRFHSRIFAIASKNLNEEVKTVWICPVHSGKPEIEYTPARASFFSIGELSELDFFVRNSDGKMRVKCIEEYYLIVEKLENKGFSQDEIDFIIPMIIYISDVKNFKPEFGNCQ